MKLVSSDREVVSKSDATIERETAAKWGGRAVACYRRYAATGDERWLVRAADYEHEALEHAATVKDHGRTVRAVQRAMERARRARRRYGSRRRRFKGRR